MSKFIDDRITVVTGGEIKQPVSFVWRDREYTIAEVVYAWPDWGFGQGTTQRSWRTRRHRNYFRVRTTDGELYELYLDRGTKPGREAWYLYQELVDDDNTSHPDDRGPTPSAP